MTKRTVWILMIGLLSAALGGCSMHIDEDVFTAEADYSIEIALPYATVTPAPMEQEDVQALVIDSEGGVTVNDSNSILQGEAPVNSNQDTNYNSLRQGNTGLAVQALQTRLQELGYYDAGVSGVFDANTEAAVRRFEQAYGTMQTGVATADLQARLFAADAPVYGSEEYNNAVISQYRMLQRGDVGSAVYAMQQRLRNLNYPITNLTGTFDNETANAVMLFYEAYGLSASDVASVAMQRELYSNTARSYGDAAVNSVSEALTVLSEDSITEIQQRLADLGYLTGDITGEQDAATQLAVKLFEEACGQLPSGTLNQNILSLLQSESAPRFESLAGQYANLIEGSSGDDVARLQQRLVDLGFATGTPNGQYGSATSASIRLFQAANGLEQTGVATTYLQAVLYSSFALDINGNTVAAAPAPTEEPEATEAPEEPSEDVEEPGEDSEDAAKDLDEAGEDSEETEDASALGTLSPGSTGDDVLRLQTHLTELGYITSLTGSYDNLTERAVSAFQTAIGREPDGKASSDLQLFLYSSVAPRSGTVYFNSVQPYHKLTLNDTGDDVTNLQQRLYELGYLQAADVSSSIGTFNDATQYAVAALQEALGYEVADGTASAELQCYLHSTHSN